ncbi:hypothetical protein KHQ06_21810 [Nocardia tengchongensis]|uniref:SMODS and SLOG-associating 2TM effector domain-containing protein n=1 Tax=Nocardia tengchongensis TaxID=2055889 RepID=A0ABX8CGL5_9NOCA|nr:hypothetical protein [Nocardia tengchongensis]QVI19099.1 hypothetical protein KHQ06_21810 [Nocardia tengchongensis]
MTDEVGIAEPEKAHRNALSLDAQRIEYMAYIWGGVYRMESTWWRRFHTVVNATAAVLAAIAGSAGLASLVSHTVAGVLALGAAAMSSVAASVGASTRSIAAQSAAIANMELKEAARRFYFTAARIFRSMRSARSLTTSARTATESSQRCRALIYPRTGGSIGG